MSATKKHLKRYKKQSGNIIVVFTIALFSLIGLSALALDGGHMLLSKSRLQNIVDSAALHAAKEIDLGASHSQARLAALAIINQNLLATENDDLETAFSYNLADEFSIDVTSHLEVDFSERPDPFVSSNLTSATYVKVVISDLELDSYLATIFGFNKQVSASALAGPSTEIIDCYNDLAPIMACGDPNDTESFGYEYGKVQLLKTGSNSDPAVGPGNFQIVRLPGDSGGNDVMFSLAGAEFQNAKCFSPGTAGLETEPGNTVGPIYSGLNTRFGISTPQLPSSDFPRDTNTCHGEEIELDENNELPEIIFVAGEVGALPAPAAEREHPAPGYYYIEEATTEGAEPNYIPIDLYDHAMYMNDWETYKASSATTTSSCPYEPNLSGQGKDVFANDIIPAASADDDPENPASEYRRILNIPIAECTGNDNGQTSMNYLGTGCFYVMQPITSQGGQDSYIVGQFIENCSVQGSASWEATNNNGPYTIVLFHVPDSEDS